MCEDGRKRDEYARKEGDRNKFWALIRMGKHGLQPGGNALWILYATDG
jgi:hypothetical protein